MQNIIEYILNFLLEDYRGYVGYGDESMPQKIIIIRDSRLYKNYGKEESLPCLPVKRLWDIPVLYGDDRIERRNGKIYIYADLVASSYFMLSGYEEMVKCNVRDSWKRFPGKESLAYKQGFIDRPIVDEYKYLLKKILCKVGINVPQEKKQIRHIYLTHDIDQPWQMYNMKTALKGSLYYLLKLHKFNVTPIKNYLGIYDDNYLEPFQFLAKQDQIVQKKFMENCQCIYFVLSNKKRQKLTETYLDDPKIDRIFELIKQNGGELGLHGSPLSNESFERVEKEKQRLERHIGKSVTKIRNHCLLGRKADILERMPEAGIKEDFSYGYADVAGFRLGTSRAVRFINPYERRLTELVLQPLIVMDGTLSDERYLNLQYKDALEYMKKMIDTVCRIQGDLNILWHNHMVDQDGQGYHRKLYEEIISYIVKVSEENEAGKRDLQ